MMLIEFCDKEKDKDGRVIRGAYIFSYKGSIKARHA